MDPLQSWLDDALKGVSNADIQSYIDDYGLTPEQPTDSKVKADVTAAKTLANANGNTGLTKVLDFILNYGDKALTILTKTGILKNQNLASAGYTFNTDTALTSSAPDANSRVFNLDFSDPKVLIILFLVVMIVAYLLFFNPSKANAKR